MGNARRRLQRWWLARHRWRASRELARNLAARQPARVQIQRWWRRVVTAASRRVAAVQLETWWRSHQARRIYLDLRAATKRLQAWWRRLYTACCLRRKSLRSCTLLHEFKLRKRGARNQKCTSQPKLRKAVVAVSDAGSSRRIATKASGCAAPRGANARATVAPVATVASRASVRSNSIGSSRASVRSNSQRVCNSEATVAPEDVLAAAQEANLLRSLHVSNEHDKWLVRTLAAPLLGDWRQRSFAAQSDAHTHVYAAVREVMGQPSERLLWHGTSWSSVMNILQSGFNRAYSGRHGIKYGVGTYFATDPSYALRFCDRSCDSRVLILARVLVGRSARGTSDMVEPPLLPAAERTGTDASVARRRYDSTVDDCSCPRIFCVFRDFQAVPVGLLALDAGNARQK